MLDRGFSALARKEPFIVIQFVTGNILDSDCQALVNPVNCVGVSGGGLALQFKRRWWPEMFKAYKLACDRGEISVGRCHIWESPKLHKVIVNFPTKDHWRNPSEIAWIRSGMEDLVALVRNHALSERPIQSVAIPMLGCGLGGLSWTDVLPVIIGQVQTLPDVRFDIYGPPGT